MGAGLLLPEIILCIAGLLVLSERLVIKVTPQRKDAAWFGAGAVVIALLAAFNLLGTNVTAFYGSYRVDDMAVFFKIVALAAAGLTLLFAPDYLSKSGVKTGDFTALVLFGATGMMLLPSALDFITLYISLELISVSFYVLIAIQRNAVKPAEAGLKYLLLSGLSSAILLYGMSLIYGLTGSTYLAAIREAFSAGQWPILAGIGCLMMLAGLGLKIYLIPFHMWAPDVYEGAPSPTVAFLASGSSAAALAAVLRVFGESFAGLNGLWAPILLVLAIITVAFGNIVALPQTNVKRMLAYSSIAHAGYILIAVVAGGRSGTAAVMYYTLLYAFSVVAAFGVISAFEEISGGERASFAGLARRAPFLAFTMMIALASLAGVPPLAGFMGKFAVFAAAVQSGYKVIAAIALLLSVISIYYYFQVIKVMYVDEPPESDPISYGFGTFAALLLGLGGIIGLGVLTGPLLQLANTAAIFARF
ncbi:MAG: NADH-quinone oxidoreductase subunit N [Bacillota bacterium]